MTQLSLSISSLSRVRVWSSSIAPAQDRDHLCGAVGQEDEVVSTFAIDWNSTSAASSSVMLPNDLLCMHLASFGQFVRSTHGGAAIFRVFTV